MILRAVLIIFFCGTISPKLAGQNLIIKEKSNCNCAYSAKSFSDGIQVFRNSDSGKKLISTIGLSSSGFKINSPISTACNKDSGEFRNRIFLCWSDLRNGGAKNEDVYLVFSDDLGKTWSDPVLVSYRPNHKRQFLPVIVTDDKNGRTIIAYYDQQNYTEGPNADLSLAISYNSGLKFDVVQINDAPFVPGSLSPQIEPCNAGKTFFVTYRRENKKWKTIRVNDSLISKKSNENSGSEIEMEKTFRFSNEIKINFKTRAKMAVSATLTRPLEPGFEKQIIKNKVFEAGNSTILVKSKELGLTKGAYILTLYFQNKNTFCWIIAED